MFSTNFIVSESKFRVVQGSPRQWTSKGGDGSTLSSHYLYPDCATCLWAESPKFAGKKIVKAGVLDESTLHSVSRPETELFVKRRVKWLRPVEGATQSAEMASIV